MKQKYIIILYCSRPSTVLLAAHGLGTADIYILYYVILFSKLLVIS